MKIRVAKRAEKIIGSLRVSEVVYSKLAKIARDKDVSVQEVVRAVLDEVVDTIE